MSNDINTHIKNCISARRYFRRRLREAMAYQDPTKVKRAKEGYVLWTEKLRQIVATVGEP